MSDNYTNGESGGNGAASARAAVEDQDRTITVDYAITSTDQKESHEISGRPQWYKPGQTGNPSGRPPGTGPTEALTSYVYTGKLPDPPLTPAWTIAKAITQRAETGDPRAVTVVLDRVDGKVPDRVQVGLLQGVTLLPSDQLDAETWGRLYAHSTRLGLADATAVPVLPAAHKADDAG